MPASIRRRERVVDHRLVVDRQQLLADGPGDRVEPRARAAGQDDPLRIVVAVAWSGPRTGRPRPSRSGGSRPTGLARHQLGVVQVPGDGLAAGPTRSLARPPAQLAADLAGVDRVAAVVARGGRRRSVIRTGSGACGESGAELVEQRRRSPGRPRGWSARCCPPMLYVSPGRPASSTRPECAGVVLDVEPVADVVAVAVDRQGLALQGVEDHQRDQLLGELVGAVVVRAVGRPASAGRRCGGRPGRGGRTPP